MVHFFGIDFLPLNMPKIVSFSLDVTMQTGTIIFLLDEVALQSPFSIRCSCK